MGVFSTIACEEIHGSRSEFGSMDVTTASVQVRTTWANRLLLVTDVVANRRQWPGMPMCKAVSGTIVPDGAAYSESGQECVYTHALVTLNYSTDANRDLIVESIEPTTEFRLLDHRAFRWNSTTGTPLVEQESVGRLERGFNLVRSMFNMPVIPATLLTLPGCVNNVAYASPLLGLTFAAETLLFGIEPIQRTITMAGTDGFDVTVKFGFKPNTWNKFWNQRTQAYEFIYREGSSSPYKPYAPASFAEWLA